MNWDWQKGTDKNIDRILTQTVVSTDACLCGTRNVCISVGGLYYDDGYQLFRMPGLNVGCSVVETLLRSTMQCLYDQACLQLLLYRLHGLSYNVNKPFTVSPLNFSNSSRFDTNTVVQYIADELFIKQWQTNISYLLFI